MSFESVYEMFNPLTELRKQHFWEWFEGSTLNSRWTQEQSGDAFMNDTIDGGFHLNANSGSNVLFGFNNIRQYDNQNSKMFSVARALVAFTASGFVNDFTVNMSTGFQQFTALMTIGGFYGFRSGNVGANTNVNSDISTDTNFHIFELELNPTDNIGSIEGIAKVVNTTTLPTLRLQPIFFAGGATGSLDVRYMEAFNI